MSRFKYNRYWERKKERNRSSKIKALIIFFVVPAIAGIALYLTS